MLTEQEEKIIDLAERRLQKGWTQHSYGRWQWNEGDVCLVGALQWALEETGHSVDNDVFTVTTARRHPALGKVWEWFKHRHHCTPTWWNDREGRSLEDVLLELKRFREDASAAD